MGLQVKGGVWTNEEDVALRAAVMKFGARDQWDKIASLFPRKNKHLCKSRWDNWIDPRIKKTDWDSAEDKRLLKASIVFSNRWHQIAGYVNQGQEMHRTAPQCLERYSHLTGKAGGASTDPTDHLPLEALPAKATEAIDPESDMMLELRARQSAGQAVGGARRVTKAHEIDYAVEVPYQMTAPEGEFETGQAPLPQPTRKARPRPEDELQAEPDSPEAAPAPPRRQTRKALSLELAGSDAPGGQGRSARVVHTGGWGERATVERVTVARTPEECMAEAEALIMAGVGEVDPIPPLAPARGNIDPGHMVREAVRLAGISQTAEKKVREMITGLMGDHAASRARLCDARGRRDEAKRRLAVLEAQREGETEAGRTRVATLQGKLATCSR